MTRDELLAVDFDDLPDLSTRDQAWWYHFRAHPKVVASWRHQHGLWPLPPCDRCGHHHVNPDDFCQETIWCEPARDDAACGCPGWYQDPELSVLTPVPARPPADPPF